MGVFTCISIAASILIFIYHLEIQTELLLTAALLMACLLAGLWALEYKNWKTAQLIMENQILHIRYAAIKDINCEQAEPKVVSGIDVFVSNFGILLDSKIIKFNQGGFQLKAVEIGRHFISFAYGTKKRMQKTWLVTGPLSDRELAEIAEKVSFETGVVPMIID